MIVRIIITFIVPLVALLIGIGLLALIQKHLSRRTPIVAIVASIAVAAITLRFAASAAGIDLSGRWLGWIVLSSFVGTFSVQSNPWKARSILRSFSVTAGIVTLFSAFTSDLMITVFALLVTVISIRLFTNQPFVVYSRATEQSADTGTESVS